MAKPLRVFPKTGDLMLEFNQIKMAASRFVKSSGAKDIILSELNGYKAHAVKDSLELQLDLIHAIKCINLGLDTFNPIDSNLQKACITDYTLGHTELLQIWPVVNQSYKLSALSNDKSIEHLRQLMRLLSSIQPLEELYTIYSKTFDKDGNVLDTASAELQSIRQKILSLKREVYATFRKDLEKYKHLKYLAEGEESVRNGRLVLRVLSEHKRKVAGMIVDESESGKTIFIEPESTLLIYNQIAEYECKEKRELKLIFRSITRQIAAHNAQLQHNYNALVFLDVMLAKTSLAILLNADMPVLSNEKEINWIEARHPLLVLKYINTEKNVVPFNISLNEENHIVVISGPNAGGKSIVLKTIGLLQLMVSNAYLVPADKSSRIYLFDKLCVDIGDNQSYSDGLSTYTAKLKNLKLFMQHADTSSLILVDEFGSGTEPNIGGAIAEAVLNDFYSKNAFCILNTHYSNLKAVAHRSKGMQNAAMLFDESDLKPTYRLSMGRPGNSYAIEIAKGLKYSPRVLNYAKRVAKKGVVDLEEISARADKERAELKTKVSEYKSKIDHLNKLIKAYEHMHKQYELKRMKLKLEAQRKEWENTAVQANNMEKLVRELRKSKNLEKATILAEQQSHKLKQLSESYYETNKHLAAIETGQEVFEPQQGDPVKLVINGMVGYVSHIENQYYSVTTENLTFKVLKKDILPAKEVGEINRVKKIQSDHVKNVNNFQATIDLRGMPPIDAIKTLEAHLDQALIQGVPSVKVIHGKGSGVLKKAVLQLLRGFPHIKSIGPATSDEGGDTITVVGFE